MRFYTIFYKCENIHLIKDVGMIPYMLHKEHGVNATIATYNNGDYPYIDSEVKGLNISFIKQYTSIRIVNIIIFIFCNFRKIDVLQTYHFSIESIIYLNFFKFLSLFNSKAKTYLKLDADDDILKLKLGGIFGFCFRVLVRNISLISVETQILHKELCKRTYFSNLIYLPNGFSGEKVEITEKEPFFLTVGRIGTYQKNTELLLEAYKRNHAELNGWKLVIIGPIEEKERDFNSYINHFFLENSHLENCVQFLGPIYDRKLLNAYYQRASVFVMSSRYESFGLVYLEALQAGSKIVSSDITPAFDIVKNEKIGYLFSNDQVDDLGLKLIKISSEPIDTKINLYIQDFAYQNFHWSKIVDELYKKLKI